MPEKIRRALKPRGLCFYSLLFSLFLPLSFATANGKDCSQISGLYVATQTNTLNLNLINLDITNHCLGLKYNSGKTIVCLSLKNSTRREVQCKNGVLLVHDIYIQDDEWVDSIHRFSKDPNGKDPVLLYENEVTMKKKKTESKFAYLYPLSKAIGDFSFFQHVQLHTKNKRNNTPNGSIATVNQNIILEKAQRNHQAWVSWLDGLRFNQFYVEGTEDLRLAKGQRFIIKSVNTYRPPVSTTTYVILELRELDQNEQEYGPLHSIFMKRSSFSSSSIDIEFLNLTVFKHSDN